MKTDIVLYLEEGIDDEALTFSQDYLPDVLKKRLSSLGSINSMHFAVPHSYSGRLKAYPDVHVISEKDDISFWKKLFSLSGADQIIKIFADSAFLDIEIIKDMLELHLKYLAEFTYSENLPQGFAAEIFSRGLLESIPESKESMIPLSDVIRSNINQFDVELYYREPDIRDKRINFRAGIANDKKIMENIASFSGGIPAYSNIREIIETHPEALFTSPAYIEIELTGRCDLDCIFCYRTKCKKVRDDMEPDLFKKILQELSSFNLPYSICFGGSGEPMMHKNFYEILDLSLKENGLKNLIIETNGIYADGNFKNFVQTANDKRIKTIFNINGMDSQTYKVLHGADYFETVYRNILSLKEAVSSKDALYIQVMKINETEVFLDKYYDFWEKAGITIILQKQNTYLGRIKDRRYSDLTPLERVPCWHLQRDMSILSDGTVPFCKQDFNADAIKGDVHNEDLTSIWKKSLKAFVNDYKKIFPHNPDCGSCDEWYTFNL